MDNEVIFGVSDFVASFNQTMEYAYPYVVVEGELANLRVSKGKWVYFDLKDEGAMICGFATVFALGSSLEDGMIVRVDGSPRLHAQYGFSLNAMTIKPVGEGAIRRAADLLRVKLEAEGLFDTARKRNLPRVPRRIALITSAQSAAYADFIKVSKARWGGFVVDLYDVLVQGEQSPEQIVKAINRVSMQPDMADVVVLIRGGGSTEDLAAFSDERVVRAVAGSRVPTLAAIGHEVDLSLVELAADMMASTPSNAAELLFPDKWEESRFLGILGHKIDHLLNTFIEQKKAHVVRVAEQIDEQITVIFGRATEEMSSRRKLLEAFDPRRPLEQGYSLVRRENGIILRSVLELEAGDKISVELQDGIVYSRVESIYHKAEEEA